MELRSINEQYRLYVTPCGELHTCYGFDVLDRKARAVAAWLWSHCVYSNHPDAALGTPEHFAQCAAVLDAGAAFHKHFGHRCPIDLVPALIGLEGRRVECDYYNGERIRFNVGRSMGWMPVHLRLHNRRSRTGDALCVEHVKNVRVIR